MKKQLWISLLALSILSLIGIGCRPPGDEGHEGSTDSIPVNGDWVRVYHSADPDGLSAFNTRNAFATFIKENMYMYLADFNSQTLTPEYTLAKGAPEISADGRSFTYEIRPEAKWDNGDPVTAKDYEFSVKVMKNPLTDASQLRTYHTYLQDVVLDPTNERRFTVTTNSDFFLAKSAIEGMEVISHKFYDPSGSLSKYTVADFATKEAEIIADTAVIRFSERFMSDEYRSDPAFLYGCGPYKLESWTPGDNVTLVRKANWWGDQLRGQSYYFKAYLEKQIFKTVKDRSTLPAAAKNGDLDVIRDMAPDDFVAARDDTSSYIYKNFNSFTPPSYNYIWVGFNMKPGSNRNPIFEDVRVRRAVAHITDIDAIIKNVYNGLGQRQIGPISPLHKDEYHSTLKPYAFDPEKAKQLLDEAGWIDADGNGVREKMIKGKKVELKAEAIISNSGDTGPRMLGMIADQAKKVGMIIEVNRIDFAKLSERAREHDFDMLGMGFSSGPLATDLKQIWATENWVNKGTNYFGFGDTTTDALIDQIRQTIPAKDRTPLYHRFQEIWLEQLPCMVIMSPTERIWVHKRFKYAQGTAIRPGYKTYELWVPAADQQFK